MEAGKDTEKVLDKVNKNTIPRDSEKTFITSGIRLMLAFITTRGFGKKEFISAGKMVSRALKNSDNNDVLASIKQEVINLTDMFPIGA